MKKRSKALASLVAASLVIAACGGDDDDSSSSGDDTSSEATTAPADDTASETTMADDTSSETTMADDTSSETTMADDSSGPAAEAVTDFGVDAENKVIRVGINGDLSGPFASLVSEVVAAQEVYWDVFNEAGGYGGWTVEVTTLDSGYATDVGIQNYQQLADEGDGGVLMITENTGSPITAAVEPDAVDDNMLLIPLSWASLWPDPEEGLAVLEKQTTYCNEAVNAVEWLKGYVEEQGLDPKLAIVSRPGEYGEDGAAGAKIAADELGIEIVYDGTSAVAGDDRTAVISELVNSGATIVWLTLTPGETLDIFGNAVSQGMEAYWSGSSPSFDYKVHLGSDFAEQFDQWYFPSSYQAPWATPGIPAMETIVSEMTARRPDLLISDVYTLGWIEGMMAEAIFRKAIDDGDLTRAHVFEIPQDPSFSVDFGGLAAPQSWPAVYDDALVRSSWIYDADATAFNVIPLSDYTPENPGSSGMIPIEQDYVGSVAQSYEYGGPCIEPSS